MLEHSNTSATHDMLGLAATLVSHEKKSSEEMAQILSIMKNRADSHSELINSLLSMTEYDFSLSSFTHVIQTLHSQSEEISSCLLYLSAPSASLDESH